ncbi:putative PPE family protein [Penicillium rolfsii]|nr:putative PPE family protein [Penicillium rolfsii]
MTHGESLGSRLTKKISKRLSHSGSKEGGKEGAIASSSKETAEETGIGQQTLNEGQEMKDQAMKGDLSGAKDIASQGESTKNTIGQGDMKGAVAGIGLSGDNANRNNAANPTGRSGGYRPSFSVSPLEYNDDIKKGPITTGIQRDIGQTGLGAMESSSRDAGMDTSKKKLSQPQMVSSQTEQGASQTQQELNQTRSAIGPGQNPLGLNKDPSTLSPGSKGLMPTQKSPSPAQVGLNTAQQGLNPPQKELSQGQERMGQSLPSTSKATGAAYGGDEMMQQELRDHLAIGDDVFGTLGADKTASQSTKKSASKQAGKAGFGAFGGGALGNIFRRASGQGKSTKSDVISKKPVQTTSQTSKTSKTSKTTETQGFSRSTVVGAGAGAGAGAALSGTAMEKAMDRTDMANTGMANTGVTNIGMGQTGTRQTGMANTGMANTGMANTGMANTGVANTGTTNNSTSQTGMRQTGMANTGMNKSGTDQRGMGQTKMGAMTGMPLNSKGQTSADLSLHGGTVRGGNAIMSGPGESPKTASSSGKAGTAAATGVAGAAGAAGMVGKSGVSNKSGMTGTRGIGMTGDMSQQDRNKDALGRGYSGTASSTTTNTSGVSTRAVRNLNTTTHKVTVLQDKVQAMSQKCKTQLGISASEISERSPTVDTFFDAVAAERLRWMPRDGSRLDCSLRWASRLAYAVDALRESTGLFAPGADSAAQLIWGFMILLLESDMDNTDLFESVFGRYGRVAVGIYLLLQYEPAYKTATSLHPEAAAVFSDLLEMVCTTTTSCIEGFKAKESNQFIEHNVDAAFVAYAKRYSTHWNAIVESATSKLVKQSPLIYSSPELGSLRQFLGVQDRPLQFILESRMHSLAEGSFEWFNSTLYEFSIGKSPVMLVTGGAGSGKSALSQWTVERLQESAEHDSWNVIPYTIRGDIPVATLTLRILKGILHQMLDHCVSDKQIQEAILVQVAKAAQGALDGAGDVEVEECLWRGIRIGLASNIQYMFVVDGLDQIKGGDGDAIGILEKFTESLSEQNVGSKMIAFTRPLSSKPNSTNIEHFTMETTQTRTDLVAFVKKMLSASAFDTAKDDQLQSAVAAIVNRSQGSFSWAEMAVEYAKQQRTLAQAVSSVQSLPQPMTELLDFHMKNLDLSQHEAISIMSWLAVSERPLLVEEIEELLRVDSKGPSFMSRMSTGETQWSNALRPLIMTRDGVVSFAHTSIRDHVITQARSASVKSPLNLKEAHLDLLMRCLGWVQLSVREETDVSMDKLSMEERNRLFDKYVILEYTARYWLSHLLTSPLVTDEGEFKFTSSFQKLMPATVLFARLELTCKESQFTRSSVVELYRLATDIRRLVLGEKSMGLLESLLLSARVSKLAHASHADEHCYEAWRLSQELLGQSNPITLSCAEMMTQSFSERGTMTAQQEDIMKYLILTDSEVTGVEFNQRLKYLGMIVGMYKSRGDNSSALLISKQFYQQILQKYGTNSRQSSEAAEFLTSQFSAAESDEMSRDIAKTKYDNVIRTMEVTDERRIKYSLYMAQLYEQQSQHAQASSVLSSLWAGLNARDIDSVDMMDKKANVALVYYQFLRRQGRYDEAEIIMRELVADLEVSGIQSPEMMQRVQLLRAETREMQMYSLDRSLSILMWRYYKQNHQEYTPEARELAMSLAEGMANSVSIEDSNMMSGSDRKLMVELLDSITSSPTNISVPTLILCHNLSSIYVREEDWNEASDCSKAVLQHVYPSIEQPGSHKKFTTELAPPVADLALILAYCHFRKLHLEQATTVYENAFGSLIASDKVPVASVLAVAKAVVEFYETTYQFTKALALLHTVSNFLTSRLGETHKHTIDNMYLEAALAERLEMNSEAKITYQRIYKNTLRDNKIAPEGLEAALALIGLYEKEMQWSSALDIYRHLWPTVVVQDNMQDYDRAQTERLLEKTYIGYMTIMTSHMKSSDFTERYKVSSEYVTTCRNVYGPTHQKTLSAILLFAELCETHESYIDQAIALYKQPLQTSEWVPTSQSSKGLDQMTQALPITLKHKLAQLFVRKRDSTSEARSLYTEEFQLGKKTQGYFSNTTLSWLRELALAHSRQGTPTSVQQGNALLHNYLMDCLHAGGDSDMMADWARKIAAIYLECGFIEGGNNVLDELRQRVISSSETSATVIHEQRDAIFTAAFEESFGRRASSDQILDEMSREMQTQQAFAKSLSGHDFIPTLISGDRLARLQADQNRTRAAMATRNKLYEYFCNTLSATSIADRDVVKQFYKICLREIYSEKYNMNILSATTKFVRDLCNAARFQDASDVTGVLHSFLHLTDGLNNYDSIITATKLCLYLSGHQAAKCEDKAIQTEMAAKSKMLLQELMASSKAIGIEIVDLPFHDLNDIITLLGEHEMFDDLEGILTQLWTSRIVQRTWTPDVVVWIGRRLVETRFCRGAVDSAIQLCRDICYNLRQVWGSCDPVTLEMTKLLSGLYTASNDHKSAAALHEGAMHDLLGDSEAKKHPRAADTASQHMELLRRAQSRLGSGSKEASTRASIHAGLMSQVADRFGLQSEQIQGVGDANGGDKFGVWSRPRRFSIDVEDLDDQGQAHQNHLRESSGAGLTNGSGAPRRISVQAL